MNNRLLGLVNVTVLILLLISAVYVPKAFFVLNDIEMEKKVIASRENTEIAVVENDRNKLSQAAKLLDQYGSKNLLALQKKQITDNELRGLKLELSKLYECGLIKNISLSDIEEHFIYVAYYNVIGSNSEGEKSDTLSVKKYEFSDYARFEYIFWVDSKNQKIYEVTLIDENEDFKLTDIDYMNGVIEYYGIDNISPIEVQKDSTARMYQVSLDDYQSTAYYCDFSIYNAPNGNFVRSDKGVTWRIFSKSLGQK